MIFKNVAQTLPLCSALQFIPKMVVSISSWVLENLMRQIGAFSERQLWTSLDIEAHHVGVVTITSWVVMRSQSSVNNFHSDLSQVHSHLQEVCKVQPI